MPKELPLTLSVDATARLLGVGRATVYNAVRDGVLPSLRLGKRILIPTGPLLELVGSDDADAGPLPSDDDRDP